MKKILILCLFISLYACSNDDDESCECTYRLPDTNTGNAQTLQTIHYPCNVEVPEPCR